MDWLFENLGKLAPLALFLFYLLSALKGKGEEEEPQDPQAAERARKIQEDIRRKIQERQREARGEVARPPEVEQELVAYEAEEEIEEWNRPDVREASQVREPPVPEPVAAAVGAFPVEEYKDTFAQQRRAIEEREAEARALLESSGIAPAAVEIAPLPAKSDRGPSPALRARVQRGLQGSVSLRSSFVLKEILDRPLGMR